MKVADRKIATGTGTHSIFAGLKFMAKTATRISRSVGKSLLFYRLSGACVAALRLLDM